MILLFAKFFCQSEKQGQLLDFVQFHHINRIISVDSFKVPWSGSTMEYIKHKELPDNPRERANCCSYLCFWYVSLFHWTLLFFDKLLHFSLKCKFMSKLLWLELQERLNWIHCFFFDCQTVSISLLPQKLTEQYDQFNPSLFKMEFLTFVFVHWLKNIRFFYKSNSIEKLAQNIFRKIKIVIQ